MSEKVPKPRQHKPNNHGQPSGFFGRVSARIIAKMLYKNKEKQRNSRLGNALRGIRQWWETKQQQMSPLTRKFASIKPYRPQILFLLAFLIILHPGIHSRRLPENFKPRTNSATNIAPRPEIYPLESMRLVVDAGRNWISLHMENKCVASYPASLQNIALGEFVIHDAKNIRNQGILVTIVASPNNKSTGTEPLVIQCKNSQQNFTRQILLDEDYLELLYAYLRIGTPVLIYRE